MNTDKMSLDDLSILICLLDDNQKSFIQEVINALIVPQINSNKHSDIIDWKRSQPFNYLHLIEQTAILRTQDYHLQPLDSPCVIPCTNCGCKTLVTMIYQKRNKPNETMDFELCLSCYTGWKMTPIYAAEGGV